MRELSKNVTREKKGFIFAVLFSVLVIFSLESKAQITKFYFDNGKISSEGLMRDGKPDGYWKTYYQDGGLKTEGNRKNFKLDSVWIFYRTDSTIERSISYLEDLKNGIEKVYDVKGKVKEQFTYKNNIKDGSATYFYDTGEVAKTLNFVNNKEEGKGLEFEKDGRVITLITYRNGFLYATEKINRYNENGKRSGIWRDLYPNAIIKEEGNWTNGLRNGVFKFFDRKGELQKMEKYVDGVLDANDGETAILDIRKEFFDDGKVKNIGSYREGKKWGTFREFDQNGKEVNGFIFENDLKVGEGLIDTIGRRQGTWKLFFPDGGTMAEGSYLNGKREGAWTYFFKSGKPEQRGTFKEDYYTGSWKWFFSSGSVHREENFRKGKEDGHLIEYDSLGNILTEGDYVDGLKTGIWRLTVNDHTEMGSYADGELNGEWIWLYENGEKAFQGEFQNGIPIGKHKYWHHSGQLKMKGEYAGGELDGRWDYFNENGTLEIQIEYEAGQAIRYNGQKLKLPKSKD